MNKKPNIFWFIIDSVRYYRTGKDDRDRIDIMDTFSKDAVEFTNAFTSAPSSLLAGGALFTGLPSSFIARHFNDWKFDNKEVYSVRDLVENHGYESYPILNSREEKMKFFNLLPPLKNKSLPSGAKLSDYAWRNSEITEIFRHLITNKNTNNPMCYVFWYDCRRDPKISDHVSEALQIIKEKNLYDDSIIIMNSDHGYPDPNTNLNESFFGCNSKKALGHDMILTDDNIKTPLIIKYPDSPKNKKIDSVVGHIDILPTIYQLLDIPPKKTSTKFSGKSLIPIVDESENNDSRIIRTDTRLTMDLGRITSFRGRRFKYIYFYDDGTEILADLKEDEKEIENFIDSDDEVHMNALHEMRKLKKEYERELYGYHYNELKQNCINAIKKLKNNAENKYNILVISKAPEELINILVKLLKDELHIDQIELINFGTFEISNKLFNKIYKVDSINEGNISELEIERKDILIYLTDNSKRVFLSKSIINTIKTIASKKYILLNYNFNSFSYFVSRFQPASIKLFFDWDIKGYFYKEEPFYFFKDIIWFLRKALSVIFHGTNQDEMAAKEIKEFRDYHVKGYEMGLDKMATGQLQTELERIKTREER